MKTLDERVWDALPARRDRSRPVHPMTLAGALNVPLRDVAAVLHEMEADGRAVRHNRKGTDSWTRGLPVPALAVQEPVSEALCLDLEL